MKGSAGAKVVILRADSGTLIWSSGRSNRLNTTLLKMIAEGAALSPAVTLRENTREGIAPDFDSFGYRRPDEVVLIEQGRYKDCLVSPRSAKEYGVATNGVTAEEMPESVEMSAGSIGSAELLNELGTGVWVDNLWYLNYSDRPACRFTGMTRFATFWVEGGRIVAPLNVMRFDETIYRALGENLVGLTKEREMILSSDTYFRRSTASARLPGALIDAFSFTL